MINDIIANPDEGFGLLVKLIDESVMYRSAVFASSDHSNPLLWPGLDIFYRSIITNDDPESEKIDCKIFPNPNTGQFILEFCQSINEPFEALVYDQYGRLIEKTLITNQITEYNWTDKPKGIYIIQVKTKYDLIIKKVVIS